MNIAVFIVLNNYDSLTKLTIENLLYHQLENCFSQCEQRQRGLAFVLDLDGLRLLTINLLSSGR